MLYDTEDTCSSAAPSVSAYIMGTLDDSTMAKSDYNTDTDFLTPQEMTKLGNLHDFLCSNYEVATNGVPVSVDYYSYTTAFDPMPCKEALISMTWAYVSTLPGVSYPMPSDVWMPHETFQQCSETWFATVTAYSLTYVASALVEENEAYTFGNIETDMTHIMFFYAFFGLFWIHSSYPNYILSDVPGHTIADNGYGPDLATYDSDVTPSNDDPLFAMADEVKNNLPDLLNP